MAGAVRIGIFGHDLADTRTGGVRTTGGDRDRSNLEEITDTDLDVRGDGWRARRLFVRDDGLGFSLSETTVADGADLSIWYKHHQEACFVIDGAAEITERDTGAVRRIGPGSAYAPQHDRHAIRVLEPLRLVCVFSPALSGRETHDADGSYQPAGD